MLSIIVPCLNEAENLPELYIRLNRAFPTGGDTAVEFVLVDDGSTDATSRILDTLAQADSRVVPLKLPVRSGQTMALWQGLMVSRGQWIAHLDGDLQNDPADLPDMLRQAIRGDWDAVLGYRAERKDSFGRRLSSRFANIVRRVILRDTIRDIGCSTRVVRREVLTGLPPITNLHRYLPALIERGAWLFVQVPVRHHGRSHGISKYGNFSRGIEGLRDLPRMLTYIEARQSELKERGNG